MAISKKHEVKTTVSKVAKPIKDAIKSAKSKTIAEKTKTVTVKKPVFKKSEIKETLAKSVKTAVQGNKKATSKTQPSKKPLLPKKNKTIIISEDAEHISDDIIISELREDLSDLDFDDDDDDM